MSKKEGAAAPLRAVPEGTEAAGPGTGLTPPHKKAGSRFISDVIVEMGFLGRERVDAAVEEGKASGRSPEQVLIEGGAITGDQLSRAVAQRFGLDHVDLSIYKTDVGALNSITPQAARRLGAVPSFLFIARRRLPGRANRRRCSPRSGSPCRCARSPRSPVPG